jgi:succinate dehydrogenase/fumarate reductase flavoprotein subunit
LDRKEQFFDKKSMEKEYDTIVIGAGAAGLAAAYELTKKGQRVLIKTRSSMKREQNLFMEIRHVHLAY